MKTYRCTNCGNEIQRPTQPFSCPACGRQAVGLFRVVSAGGQAQSPGQQGFPPPAQPTPPPARPGVPPAGHGGITPPGPPPGQPARPPQPQPPQAQAPRPAPTPPPSQPPAGQAPAPPPPAQARPQRPPAQPERPPAATPPQQPRSKAPPDATSGSRPAPPPLPKEGTPGTSRPKSKSSGRPAQRPPTARPKAVPEEPPTRLPEKPPARGTHRPSPPARRPGPAAREPEPLPARQRVRPVPVRPEPFLWACPDPPPYEEDAKPMRNAPAVDPEGRIVFCSQGRLVALAEEDGKPVVVWDYVLGSHVPGPVVVDAEGNVRAHSSDGFLHCVSPGGKQVFSPAHVGEPLGWAAPVVDEVGNTYISSYDGGLVRVDAEGKMLRRPYFRSRRKLDSTGTIRDGVLFVGSEDGYVFAIELGPDRGVNLWDHAADNGFAGGFLNSAPAVDAEGRIVVAARDETLYGFLPTGVVAWSTKMPGLMLGSPVIDPHGHVYVGVARVERGRPGRGFLVCVDGNSHKVRWQHDADGPVESTPVVGDDDTVYFGDNAGTVHALDLQGNTRWTAGVESPVRSALTIPAPHRLAFGQDDDTLVVLQCSSTGLAPEGWPKLGRTLSSVG